MRSSWIIALAFLGACAAAPEPTPPAPDQVAFFNHGYAVIDAGTAAAISESALVRELMTFEQRTTVANDGATWTARYLYGRQTYFEFFGPGDLGPGMERPQGGTGLAISPDQVGGLAALRARLEAAGASDIVSMRRTRLLGEAQVDWFDVVSAQSLIDNVSTMWAMEYLPSYFDQPLAEKEPAEGPDDVISRERYHADTYRERLAHDITAIDVAAPVADIAEMSPIYEAAGFTILRGDGRAVARDGEIAITFVEATPETSGLRRLEFALNAPTRSVRSERVGRSTLVIGPGQRAVWTFD